MVSCWNLTHVCRVLHTKINFIMLLRSHYRVNTYHPISLSFQEEMSTRFLSLGNFGYPNHSSITWLQPGSHPKWHPDNFPKVYFWNISKQLWPSKNNFFYRYKWTSNSCTNSCANITNHYLILTGFSPRFPLHLHSLVCNKNSFSCVLIDPLLS